MRRGRGAKLGAVALAVLAAGVVPGQALATHNQDPPRILLQARGETQRAVQGTFCVSAPPHGDEIYGVNRCADAVDWDPARFTAAHRATVIRLVVRNAVTAEGAVFARRLDAAETVVRRFNFTTPVRRWRVLLPPGRYELDVNVRSFEMPDGRSGDSAAALGLRVLGGNPWLAVDLTGRLGENGAGGRGESIIGRVVDGCGQPVVRAPLDVIRTRPVVPLLLIGVHTTPSGHYSYQLVKPARYWIRVSARGLGAQTKTVRVRAGQSVRVDFRFRRCAGGPALAG